MGKHSPAVEAIKFTIIIFLLFCGVRTYALLSGVKIFHIPVLDPLLTYVVQWLKTVHFERYFEGAAEFLRSF